MRHRGVTGIGLGTRNAAGAGAVLAVALLAVGFLDRRLDEEVVASSRRSSEHLAEVLQISVQQLGHGQMADPDLLTDIVHRAGGTRVKSVTVLDPDQRVLAGTDPMLLIEEAGGPGDSAAWDVLLPISLGASKAGFVQLRLTTAPLEGLLGRARLARVLLLAVILGVGLLLTLVVSRRIARPLRDLARAARSIAAGRLDAPLPAGGSGEVGELVESFRTMVTGLEERGALRARLDAAERDALLGRVAAGIAHDIRNPLNYVSLAADHLVAVAASEEAKELGAEIRTQLARANRTIGDLLSLARKAVPRLQEVRVRDLLESLAREAPPGREVLAGGADPGAASWDAELVEGALRNLITNALEASSGVVELVAEALDQDRIRVQVLDRGAGMDDETLAKMFEPYFTTKASGIGLGLVIARRNAESHGGTLTAAHRPGGGTVLEMVLPRHPKLEGGEA